MSKRLASAVPEGTSGAWAVQCFTVSEDEAKFDALRSAMHGDSRHTPPGTYTKLVCNGHVVMSDTPDELRDFRYFVHRACGSVLINGLGLGCVVQALLAKPEVSEVTVVEISQDVINLVSPTLCDPRLTIICADAYEWQPPKGKRWNFVWHDIWTDLCTDNLALMGKLHRKYGRRCDMQESWCHALLKYRRSQERRAGW